MNRHTKPNEVTLTAEDIEEILQKAKIANELGILVFLRSKTVKALCKLASEALVSRIPHKGVVS